MYLLNDCSAEEVRSGFVPILLIRPSKFDIDDGPSAAYGEVPQRKGDLPGVLPLVDRAGSDRLRGGPVAGHVPLPGMDVLLDSTCCPKEQS